MITNAGHEALASTPPSPETLAGLQNTVQEMAFIKMKRGGMPDLATMTFVMDEPDFDGYDFVELDFETRHPDSAGSGQVADEELGIEYVVWSKTESGIISHLGYRGRQLTPYGYISELRNNPDDEKSILSRILLPTIEGVVLEVNEGEYLGRDPHHVRELGEQAVQSLITDMQTALSHN